LLDALTDRFHDLQIDAEKIVTAHTGLARHTGGDDYRHRHLSMSA
jgi:hypothetical protein